MPQFKCVDVGAACKGEFSAENTEDLVRIVSEHFQTAHKIKIPSRTIMDYVVKKAT